MPLTMSYMAQGPTMTLSKQSRLSTTPFRTLVKKPIKSSAVPTPLLDNSGKNRLAETARLYATRSATIANYAIRKVLATKEALVADAAKKSRPPLGPANDGPTKPGAPHRPS